MSAERTSTNAATITPRRIRWLWQGRLALRYVSLWSGESSIGKTIAFCWVAAQLTHGRLGGRFHGEPTRVLIVATEDAREDMWVPRLMAAGADLSLIEFLDQDREWNLRDGMAQVDGVLDSFDAKLVFVDSVMEHLPEPKGGGENANSPTFVRRALGPFSDLCKQRTVAGLVSTHPPKSRGSTFADYVMASAAFVHVSRVGLLFAWHPDDLELPDQERRRVLMRPPGGSNIGRDPGALEFAVQAKDVLIEHEAEEVPYVTGALPSAVTFRDLTRVPHEEGAGPSLTATLKLLIAERLGDGQWHRSMQAELEAATGAAQSTVYRAAAGVVKKEGPDGAWWWAAKGTPKSSFVHVAPDDGNNPSRAGGISPAGNNPPKPPQNGVVEPCSLLPAELDETTQDEGLFPSSQPPHGRSRAREADTLTAEGARAKVYAAQFKQDQREGRWGR
jgi:hypothetical protein